MCAFAIKYGAYDGVDTLPSAPPALSTFLGPPLHLCDRIQKKLFPRPWYSVNELRRWWRPRRSRLLIGGHNAPLHTVRSADRDSAIYRLIRTGRRSTPLIVYHYDNLPGSMHCSRLRFHNHIRKERKGKERKPTCIAPIVSISTTKRSDVDHTELPANTPHLPFLRISTR